jgi:hypothetical protein
MKNIFHVNAAGLLSVITKSVLNSSFVLIAAYKTLSIYKLINNFS